METTLSNLLAYCGQLTLVVLVAAVAAAVMRIGMADVRELYWRAVLVLAVVLPWLQGRREIVLPAQSSAFTRDALLQSSGTVSANDVSTLPSAVPGLDWSWTIAWVLLTGIVLRLAWMKVSWRHLHRLRKTGTAVSLEWHDELQSAIGTTAEIRYVPTLRQPVTFGVLRPLVLLPEAVRAHPEEVQRAILCHELYHVRRRDWLWVLGEESVRALLWFHPAVWWLISRVQLAREEVVDELSITTTGRRRTYIEALLAFADETPLAPAFSRRRHLFRRVTLISKESMMSARQVVISCAVMVAAVGAGSRYAVHAFPLTRDAHQQTDAAAVMETEQGPLERRAKPITPENPIPRRLRSVPVPYPAEFVGSGLLRQPTFFVTLDETGTVREVRLAGGRSSAIADAFVRTARQSLLQWQFAAPAEAPLTFHVTFSFLEGADTVVALGAGQIGIEALLASLTRQAARAHVNVSAVVGPDGVIERMDGVIGRIDGKVPGGVTGQVSGGVTGRIAGTDAPPSTDPPTAAPRPTPPAIASPVASPVYRAGPGGPKVIKRVDPSYTAAAVQARVEGTVVLEVRIEPDGAVTYARPVKSIPLLDQSAIDAALQWKFSPTFVSGPDGLHAVPVIVTIEMEFALKDGPPGPR